jgi:hypothetical protein
MPAEELRALIQKGTIPMDASSAQEPRLPLHYQQPDYQPVAASPTLPEHYQQPVYLPPTPTVTTQAATTPAAAVTPATTAAGKIDTYA